MELDIVRLFEACNPSKTLMAEREEDRQYYIDFSPVRGGKIIRTLGRTVTLSPDKPTCQLFTGHIGCGKSTELFRLKAELEKQGFHVVYFESNEDLDMGDIDITDILLAIARQVSESLETLKIRLRPKYFSNLFEEVADFLRTPLDLNAEAELSLGIAKITAKTKDSPKLRNQLRQYLEPRTKGILTSINEELLGHANQELRRQGKKGLVVIVDNLDRVDVRPMASGRTQPEYLFVDRGEQLGKLNCHVVYTIPLVLIFSNELGVIQNRFSGVTPVVLPMVPVQFRDGRECQEGMGLLRQMVLSRAFPRVDAGERLSLCTELFDSAETLDRLCRVSGGHVRNLLGLLYGCIQQEDPPISRTVLEEVIRADRDNRTASVMDDEWELLRQVVQQQSVAGEAGHERLLRSMFVFEYRDDQGRWFGVNPILAESNRFKFCLN
ncbi:P-loop NTPase fold protein [Leptolyngbya sp. FACHB-261]|uniref:P-loop NTPase fold protein n=1 Tax=Leptolyngbya sp. FACHB-261 TaxID=2692806 RepID=UPI00168727F2|nr:P-loop NTPase fold protein [Leptolyngbya sp. FACHB-261]MBD2099412.1 AAA family ATPase [Leptolyngbya sp. FACHB-261]